VNIRKGEQFAPEFLKFSPNNRMPAIIDHKGPGGKPLALFESGAILLYLRRSPLDPLRHQAIRAPLRPRLKARVDCITEIVILTKRATRAAGTGFWPPDSFAPAKPAPVLKSRSAPLLMASRSLRHWMQRLRTGIGGAYAPLSEILRCARVARFSRDDTKATDAAVCRQL
jgi:glutathione S-transferase